MEILSLILSILGMLSMIAANLTKGEKMKQILFFVFCGNFLVATSYLVGGKGFNGAASCYLGSIQAVINYLFSSKGKELPKWLLGVYALAFIGVNIAVGGVKPLTFLAIASCMIFIVCISQKNGSSYRFWTILNNALWCVYAVLSGSYSALATHIPIMMFSVVGKLIHDRKNSVN